MSQQQSAPRSLRILVVEDNRDAAMTLKTLLVMKGYVVHNAYDGLKAVRMIALTAWGDDEQRQRSAAVGCECHLVKPVRFIELMNVLEQ